MRIYSHLLISGELGVKQWICVDHHTMFIIVIIQSAGFYIPAWDCVYELIIDTQHNIIRWLNESLVNTSACVYSTTYIKYTLYHHLCNTQELCIYNIHTVHVTKPYHCHTHGTVHVIFSRSHCYQLFYKRFPQLLQQCWCFMFSALLKS